VATAADAALSGEDSLANAAASGPGRFDDGFDGSGSAPRDAEGSATGDDFALGDAEADESQAEADP
jgi:hypothetical protein